MSEGPTHRSPAPTAVSNRARSQVLSSSLEKPITAESCTQSSPNRLLTSDLTNGGTSLQPTSPPPTPSLSLPAAPVTTLPVYAHWSDQPSIRTWMHHFAGWRVLYTSHGNSTLLLSSAGPMHYLNAPVSTLVDAVADLYYLDLAMLHKLYFKWTGHRLAMPIPVGTSGDMLVAFKTRQPRATNDGVHSYIASTEIQQFVAQPNRTCTLVMKSGYVIETLWSVQQCIEQVRLGGLFLTMLIHEHAIPSTAGMTNRCTPEPFIHLARGSRHFKWY